MAKRHPIGALEGKQAPAGRRRAAALLAGPAVRRDLSRPGPFPNGAPAPISIRSSRASCCNAASRRYRTIAGDVRFFPSPQIFPSPAKARVEAAATDVPAAVERVSRPAGFSVSGPAGGAKGTAT